MDLVHSTNLKRPSEFPNLRNIIHNIFCWGCDLEARGLRALHTSMIEWQKVQSGKVQLGEEPSNQEESDEEEGFVEEDDVEEDDGALAETTPEKPAQKKRKKNGPGSGGT